MATNPSQFYHVIRKPMMTEKTSIHQERQNKYTFRVHRHATKPEIRKAIETLFNVKVTAVNVVTMPSKAKRALGRPGHTRQWKKAVVTLQAGNHIDLT